MVTDPWPILHLRPDLPVQGIDALVRDKARNQVELATVSFFISIYGTLFEMLIP